MMWQIFGYPSNNFDSKPINEAEKKALLNNNFRKMKFGSSFTNAKFVIEGYASPFRYGRNYHGRGILLFIRQGRSYK